MTEFKSILENKVEAEIVEKKSRFIANVFYVESVDEAEQRIKDIKKTYHDAKHNCFAYLIYNDGEIYKKYSDDGEPSGTAGAPMMEIIEKENIRNIVVVVTRYFGGILLGTGGLVRAYSEALKEALKKATFVSKEHGYEVSIQIPYPDFEKFKYYCKSNNILITDSNYADTINCTIELNDNKKDMLIEDINTENNFNILKFDIIRQKNISRLSN